MLLWYRVSDFEMVPFAQVIYGISSVCTFHIHRIYVKIYLNFKAFLASFLAASIVQR
jgi:hypothetical protein